ncbi:Protein CBG01542 [Caenorhabditis briggsae]|uniref:Uncharacterized protein n=2 Tax=Caenorhabditis briggsae TaxID=6238 RepID=A0AAE9AGS6_CAEBR|nr:Protein CBG01542 [Caenorhabditis briggsae]ULT96687.1 hypothetical protein L3Y34_004912 [Caenorhabditis briggsae]UMM29863.1 hypothetical protein L5515_012009 [Caenorhabditis briggsae]CAP23058.1 Protein CBG01542 [Caenorhabditis briggsae]
MKSFTIIFVFIAIVLIRECSSLTMQGLFRKLKEARTQQQSDRGRYPDEARMEADSISRIHIDDKSFIRPVASIAGRPVIPRRWTYGQPISEVFIDENGIAIPVRPTPSLNSILRSRGGLY